MTKSRFTELLKKTMIKVWRVKKLNELPKTVATSPPSMTETIF